MICGRVTEEAAAFAPHLIILDIALPCFDGYHWCRELRKQTNAPILFLSSASDNMNVIMAMNFGGDDFIAKPFDGGVLMAKVQAMLRRSYDLSAPAVLRERYHAARSFAPAPRLPEPYQTFSETFSYGWEGDTP